MCVQGEKVKLTCTDRMPAYLTNVVMMIFMVSLGVVSLRFSIFNSCLTFEAKLNTLFNSTVGASRALTFSLSYQGKHLHIALRPKATMEENTHGDTSY